MAIYMASSRGEDLQRELLEGGYAPDTPCVVVKHATWPEELVLRCPLRELEERVAGLETMTMVLVGPALAEPDSC
jgi:precorrin-4/cobalt-precorrin-4 C11-methyltransferase